MNRQLAVANLDLVEALLMISWYEFSADRDGVSLGFRYDYLHQSSVQLTSSYLCDGAGAMDVSSSDQVSRTVRSALTNTS